MGIGKIARRTFLGVLAVGAGVTAFGYWQYRRPYDNPLADDLAEGEATFNPFVKIAADNTITVITPRAEMGQGVQTTLAALVAEELDVRLDQLTVEHGAPSAAYYNEAMLAEGAPFPMFDESFLAEFQRGAMTVMSKFLGLQVTGGSSSMIDAYGKMREAGCAARHALMAAAGERWGVAPATLETSNGTVTNPATGDSLTYGDLAVAAARAELPSDMTLRPRSDWKILGRPVQRVEMQDKVTGGRIFGIDVELPDMLHATVRMSPRFGATAERMDDSAALAIPGVRRVVPIESTTGTGFGVIADTTWAAFKGAEALEITWGPAPYPGDDAGIAAALETALGDEPVTALMDKGDAAAVIAEAPAAQVLQARYSVPYLAHACMEPMNATARLAAGKLEIWTGTQAPGIVAIATARQLGIETEDVTVNVTHLGGGFGRRGEIDYPVYAAEIARHTDGRPVKVTWTREEDTRHDTYRPAALGAFSAKLRSGGAAEAVEMKIAAPSIMKSVIGRTFPDMSAMGPDKTITDGAFNQPVMIENHRVTGHEADLTIPVGFWRAVGNSFNGFFHEGFMDEMAVASGMDPLDYRLAMMGDDPRLDPARGVLRKVAEMSGWGAELPDGKGQGIAHIVSFGTWTAMVVQVDASGGDVVIEKVWCAADPGEVLDPGMFTDQITSAAIFGFSSAMGQELTFVDGEVQQGNFWDYGFMNGAQCPEFEVAFLETSKHLGGAGEVGTPPSIPALANAIYAATGERLREMPFTRKVTFANA
ncbi:MAG: molybdopterin cofactor-binding domain-containing protein [Pseudomonadota bacterium]